MLKYKDALTAFEQKHGELLVADLADTDVYKLYHDPIANLHLPIITCLLRL